MKRTNDKIKAVIVIIAVMTLIVGAVGVYAYTTWTQTGTYTLGLSSMSITSVPSGTNIDLGVVTASSVKTVAYTIINDGPTSITVSGAVSASGCTAALTPPSGGLIPGQSAVITLTLSSFTASGSYTVTFTAT